MIRFGHNTVHSIIARKREKNFYEKHYFWLILSKAVFCGKTQDTLLYSLLRGNMRKIVKNRTETVYFFGESVYNVAYTIVEKG